MFYSPNFIDRDTELQPITRICYNSRLLEKQQLMKKKNMSRHLNLKDVVYLSCS